MVPVIDALQASNVWLMESAIDASTYSNMVSLECASAASALSQLPGLELQAVAALSATRLQAVNLESLTEFIAMTDAAHAAPQAVAAATELYCVNSADCTGPSQWFVALICQTGGCALPALTKTLNKAKGKAVNS